MTGLPSIRQLRAFDAIYELGHISAAAEKLALTQPAVTVLLRDLEARLGVRLFDRSTRSLQRTEAATEAIAYVERIFAELEAFSKSMADLAGGKRGRVSIAVTSSLAQSLVPNAISRFKALSADVHVIVDDCSPREFIDAVRSGRVDFGIGSLEVPVPGFTQQAFAQDQLCAVAAVKPAAGLRAARSVTWKQVAADPLIVVRHGYGVRRQIDEAAAGLKLDIAYEVSLLSTAIGLARSGLGTAIVPRSAIAAHQYPNLTCRQLTRPRVERHTAVIRREHQALTPAAQAFVDLLLKEEPSLREF